MKFDPIDTLVEAFQMGFCLCFAICAWVVLFFVIGKAVRSRMKRRSAMPRLPSVPRIKEQEQVQRLIQNGQQLTVIKKLTVIEEDL